MADTKISALTAATSANGGMEVAVNDGGTPKKMTLSQAQDLLGLVKGRVAADHAISATTATEVTLTPTPTLVAGTYMFQFSLLLQSATVTVSPMIGLNYTGTVGKLRGVARFVDVSVVSASALGAMDDAPTAGSPAHYDGLVVTTASTTAPNIGITVPTNAVTTINVDNLMIIEGILVATTGGDFELWHGSETATSTTVKADSSFMITRVA